MYRHIILIDKPTGITSREVSLRVKNIFKCKKSGHAGTLDPRATGLLIIALDEATKIMHLLMGLDKEYEGIIYIHRDIDIERIRDVINRGFIGTITQTPPVKSRVARRARQRNIYSFDILKKEGKYLHFRITVDAGTYIRKIASDLGETLGLGAHLQSLRRTKIGRFSVEDAVPIEKINKDKLLTVEEGVKHVKKAFVRKSSLEKVKHGLPITKEDAKKAATYKDKENIAVILEEKLIAVGVFDSKRGVIKIDRVLN